MKMIIDEMPNKQLLVSGSSSLDLANEINEPLTGRKKTFYLYPISFLELSKYWDQSSLMSESNLDQVLRFGSYPETFDINDNQEKEEYLLELAGDYLYKDILEYQDVRNPEQLRKLLVALALQIGQEVSKSRKIYFYDLGIRNALIKNFNSYELRQDKGQAWENFLVSERKKRDFYLRELKNYYFWRTYDQKEIDLVEERAGKLVGFEFKWQKDTFKKPLDFLNTYIDSEVKLVNRDNFLDFVI